jgi:hypothetical protein
VNDSPTAIASSAGPVPPVTVPELTTSSEVLGHRLAPGVEFQLAYTVVVPLPRAHLVVVTCVRRFVTDVPPPPSKAAGRHPLIVNVRSDASWCALATAVTFVHCAVDACAAEATSGTNISEQPAMEIAMRTRVGRGMSMSVGAAWQRANGSALRHPKTGATYRDLGPLSRCWTMENIGTSDGNVEVPL